MIWRRFFFTIHRHPVYRKLKSYWKDQFWMMVDIAFSEDTLYGPLGVIEFLDDEIARAIDMDVNAFLTMKDALIEKRMLGLVTRPDGRTVYEIAEWVVPSQNSIQAQGTSEVRDGRIFPQAWAQAPEAEPQNDLEIDGDMTDTSRKAQLERERTELSKWRKAFRAEHRRNPSKKEEGAKLIEYRAEQAAAARFVAAFTQIVGEAPSDARRRVFFRRLRETGDEEAAIQMVIRAAAGNDAVTRAGNDSPSDSPEAGNDLAEKAGNVTCSVTSPTTESEEEKESESDNNISKLSGNAQKAGNKAGNVTSKTLPAFEQDVVVALLCEKGVNVPSVPTPIKIGQKKASELAALPGMSVERVERQMRWLPYRKMTSSWGGLLIDAIRYDHPCPEGYAEIEMRAVRAAAEAREREEAQQRRAEAAQAKAKEAEELKAFGAALPQDRVVQVHAEVRNRLNLTSQSRLARLLQGEPIPKLIQDEMDKVFLEVLAQWRASPPPEWQEAGEADDPLYVSASLEHLYEVERTVMQ